MPLRVVIYLVAYLKGAHPGKRLWQRASQLAVRNVQPGQPRQQPQRLRQRAADPGAAQEERGCREGTGFESSSE